MDDQSAPLPSRQSRSINRTFARIRQTRVTSVSPTPTHVGSIRQRTPSQHRTLSPDAFGKHSSRRLRSQSRHTPSKSPASKQDDKASAPTKTDDLEKAHKFSSPLPLTIPYIVRVLPHPMPHFLGYRRSESELHEKHRHIKPYPSIIPALHYLPLGLETLLWTFFGSFVSLAIVQLVFGRTHHFTSSTDVPPHTWASPIIVGSFGASSVLLYVAHTSPLGQPRCFVLGQTFSAIAGVAMTKLIKLAGPFYYNLSQTDTPHSLVWVAGSLATGVALLLMTITGTVHPPGGATALLCATNSQVERMGWRIIPVVLLSSLLMLVWTFLFMNLGRKRYPENFFSPSPKTAKDGNYSQLVVDWLSDKIRKFRAGTQYRHSNANEASTSCAHEAPHTHSNGAPATGYNGGSAQEEKQVRTAHGDGSLWQDESGWTKGEQDERVERPSRWTKSTTR